MSSVLIEYLSARADAATFILPFDYAKTVEELFPHAESLLPEPYKIFLADETQAPILGFPLAETAVIKELDAKLDRWLTDEVAWQVTRSPNAKEKAQISQTAYLTPLMKVAENAMMSNLLNDYHAVFWLAHSFDIARHFSSIPRRVSSIEAQAGRTQGDAFKYRIFAKWSMDTRDQMTQLASKAASLLDGEEQRALQFFRLLQDDVLIFTEEFIGPDLRELRSFLNGYLRRDFQGFRDGFERLRNAATELLQRDRTFRIALPSFGLNPDQGISTAILLDARFQAFLFELPAVQNTLSREDREQFQLISKRLREFSVLNQLRRGIVWMVMGSDGSVSAADKRSGIAYSRSTRPLDFGRPGVLDPMVHRFGLIYAARRTQGRDQLLSANAAVSAPAGDNRPAPSSSVRKVPRRWCVLHDTPRDPTRSRRSRDPTLLRRDAQERVRLQQRIAHRAELRLLPASADEGHVVEREDH